MERYLQLHTSAFLDAGVVPVGARSNAAKTDKAFERHASTWRRCSFSPATRLRALACARRAEALAGRAYLIAEGDTADWGLEEWKRRGRLACAHLRWAAD